MVISTVSKFSFSWSAIPFDAYSTALFDCRKQRQESGLEKKQEKEALGWEAGRPPLKREWSGKDLSEFPHTVVLLPGNLEI